MGLDVSSVSLELFLIPLLLPVTVNNELWLSTELSLYRCHIENTRSHHI